MQILIKTHRWVDIIQVICQKYEKSRVESFTFLHGPGVCGTVDALYALQLQLNILMIAATTRRLCFPQIIEAITQARATNTVSTNPFWHRRHVGFPPLYPVRAQCITPHNY